MNIQRIEEFQITPETHAHIQTLFAQCFPDYPEGRSYYKQVPSFRFLVWEKEVLIAHLGIEYRMIHLAEQPMSIFGIVDLCVLADFQSKKIATTLLQQAEQLAKENGIDFMVLTSSDHRFYTKNGYALVENECRWLLIHRHQTLGVAQRRIANSLMVKAIGKKVWQAGSLDFMGHIF